MRNSVVILAAALILTSCATKSSFHSFYKENRQTSDFSISTPAFFANIFIPKDDVEEYKELFKKVKHYKVMVFSKEKTLLDRKFKKFIKRRKYTSILRINDKGNDVQFYFLENKNVIKEIVLKVKSDDSYVLLGLKTNILNSELNEIIEDSDIKLTSY